MGRQTLLGVGGPRWSPGVPGNLLAWYDASFGVTESSGAVSQWDDRSGHGYHLTQSSASFKPTYSATGWNSNRPTLIFDGGDVLQTTAALATYPNGSSMPLTIFATLNKDAGELGTVCEWHDEPGVTTVYEYRITTSDEMQMFNGSAYTGTEDAAGIHRIAFIYRQSDGLLQSYVDAALDINTTAPATLGSLNSFNIGANWNVAASGFVGKVSELVIYSATLTSAQWDAYRKYSASKWGGP